MLTIGIDPGLTGAAALIGPGGLLELIDLPTCSNGMEKAKVSSWIDVASLRKQVWDWSSRHHFAMEHVSACIERPIPMPSMPSTTIASTFDTFGAIRALMTAQFGKNVLVVEPRKWKRLFGLKGGKDEKVESRRCAMRLYPGATPALSRVKDHNRAEAVLIAHWAMETTA
jgi:crossover junction endodeoxyribonuclease RuvC